MLARFVLLGSQGQQLPQWPLSTRAREWLLGLTEGVDVKATVLWMMAHHTGFDFGVSKFKPWELHRNPAIPIIAVAEIIGME